MGSVDFSDQMVAYYLIRHRSWKRRRRIFFYHLIVSVHNAYIVAKAHNEDRTKKIWP